MDNYNTTLPSMGNGINSVWSPLDDFSMNHLQYAFIHCPLYILLALVPIQLVRQILFTSKRKRLDYSKMPYLAHSLALVVFLIILSSFKNNRMTFTHYIEDKTAGERISTSPTTHTIAFILVAFIYLFEKMTALSMKLPLFIFWAFTSISLSLDFYQKAAVVDSYEMETMGLYWAHVTYLSAVVLQCLLLCLRGQCDEYVSDTTAQIWIHPQDESSWFGDFTLQWTHKFVKITSKRTMLESDVYDLAPRDRSRQVAAMFEKNLAGGKKKEALTDQSLPDRYKKEEVEMENPTEKDRKPGTHRISLLKVLIKTFGFKFLLLQSLEGVAEMAEFVTPVLLKEFMEHIQNRESEHWSNGLAIVCTIFLVNGFVHILHHRLWATTCRLLKQIRGSIIISVFKKSLSIKNECIQDLTTGEIANLISDDIDKMYDASQELFRILSTPITIGVSLYLLYDLIGNAILVVLVIMIISIPLNKHMGKSIEKLYTEKDKAKYKRTKLMNEIINGIKLLKLYSWEPPFMKKVQDVRKEEEKYNNSISLLRAGIDSVFRAVPFLVKTCSFGVFMMFGGRLDATKCFVTVHLFHILNDPISSLATLLPEYVEAMAALRRIEKFLSGDNIPHDIVIRKSKTEKAISISSGEFTWDTNQSTSTLRNIDVDIDKGSLIAIVGQVGSGKSSILAAILGEMEKLKGVVEVNGRVAFVPQEAWIQNATLQDNILFGSPMDADRYKCVVDACDLEPDINSMSAGDQTEIGERGINLSGGQKQRLSLARALYSDADVFIFDDALSAVDVNVGTKIFNDAIGHNSLLKGKTRVLVTHGHHLLPYVDFIIVMDKGQIYWSGTYQYIVSPEGTSSELKQNLQTRISDNQFSKSIGDKQNRTRKVSYRKLRSIEDTSKENPAKKSQDDDGKSDNSESDDGSSESSDESGDGSDDQGKADDENTGILIKDEEMQEGKIKLEVYVDYLRAIGYKLVFFFVSLFVVSSSFGAYSNHLVKEWTDDPRLDDNSTYSSNDRNDLEWNYFLWYTIAGAVEVVGDFVFIIVTRRGTFNASTRLHDNLLYRILRCPIAFFDTTPKSRIITRFSKDVSKVDGLGSSLRSVLSDFFNIFIFLAMIVIHCPSVGYYIIALSIAYFMLYKFHHGSIRQLKRYMSKYKPPIISHFTETIDGMASVRAYECQQRFLTEMENHIDEFTKYDLMELWCEMALNLRSGLLYHLVALTAGVVCLLDTNMTAGMAGLVMMYTDEVCDAMDQFCWHLALSETDFVSLEKITEYSKKPSEPEWQILETQPPTDWPNKGNISFNDYTAKYRPELDLVLSKVNCVIKPQEKVGIVGRTGAGKTSLTMALFRLLETSSGSIVVDGEDIAGLGLHTLRSRINIIPQDPVIFSGTIKMNLDPLGECSDDKLWNAIRRSHLEHFVSNLPQKLDFVCGGGGKNLSVGQRQLLCLARSLLRKTKILVLDEATAAVDKETDELIQETIRTEFSDCTVLTVAHRINTLQDYDQILVIDQGTVKEFDSPESLLRDQNSIFYGMVKASGLI